MTHPLPPFAAASYQLASCTLTSLTVNEAEPLSGQLATMNPWFSLGYSAEGLLRYLLRPDPALYRFAIRAEAMAQGLVCVRYPWLRGPCLELLAVLAGQQRRGFGREVMSWLQAQCPRTAPNIWTLTSSFNTGARAFYRTHGFTEVVSLPNLLTSGADEILLRKELP